MKFSDLVNRRVDFYGVDNYTLCVRQLPDGERVAFEAVEDPDDGYRSALDELKEVPLDEGIYFQTPIAQVTIRDIEHGRGYEAFTGYELVDDSGHVWLRAGTSNYDDYYPCFCFEYNPPRPA